MVRRPLLLLAISLHSVRVIFSYECEEGWIEHWGNCYLYDENDGPKSSNFCRSYCEGFGAHMPCVEDARKENFLTVYDGHGGDIRVLIDYSDSRNDGSFSWGPECANAGYMNWGTFQPSGDTSENCTLLSILDAKPVGWMNVPCEQSNGWCYCEKEATGTAHHCPQGWASRDDSCYAINIDIEPSTFDNCETFCSSMGSGTLCIEDQEKEDYVLDLMQANDLPAVWLSYSNDNTGNIWQWPTATCPYSTYSNWDLSIDAPSFDPNSCALLYSRDSGAAGWGDLTCGATFEDKPAYCICEGNADDHLLPYLQFSNDDAGNSSSNNTDGKANTFSTTYIIITAVLGGGFVLLLLCAIMWHYCIRQHAGLTTTSIIPGQYDSAPTVDPYAQSSAPQYSASNNGYGRVPQQHSIASGGHQHHAGNGVAHQQHAKSGASIPASAPPPLEIVATAVAIPDDESYGNFGYGQVVVAHAMADDRIEV